MKITALLVLKSQPIPDGSDPVILANATDVSHFGYFQRVTVRQFIVFVGRTVAKRTPPDQRHTVQHEGYTTTSVFSNLSLFLQSFSPNSVIDIKISSPCLDWNMKNHRFSKTKYTGKDLNLIL